MIGPIGDAGQGKAGRVQQNNGADTARARKNIEGRSSVAPAGGSLHSDAMADTVFVSGSARAQHNRSAAQGEGPDSGLFSGFSVAEKSGTSSLAAESPKKAAEKARAQAVFAPIKAVGSQANVDANRAMKLLG